MAIASEVKIRRTRRFETSSAGGAACRKGHKNLPFGESFMELHQLDECRLCRRQKHSVCSKRCKMARVSSLMARLIFEIFSHEIVAQLGLIFYIVESTS